MERNRATANSVWSAMSLLLRYDALGYRSLFLELENGTGMGCFGGFSKTGLGN